MFRKLGSVILGTETGTGTALDSDALEAMVNLQFIAKSLSSFFNAELNAHNLSEGKLSCLMFVFIEDLKENHAPSPSDVADGLAVTRATVTGLLDGLERDGYIERRRESRDRRAVTVHITDKSRQTLKEMMPGHAQRITAAMAPLTTEEKQQLVYLLRKVDVSQAKSPE